MSSLLTILILATGVAAPTEVRYRDAVEFFHGDSGPHWDQSSDGWPDRCTRRRSPAFPSYLPVQIQDDPSVPGGHCLRIDLDGGAAAISSPPLKVNAIFSYVIEAQVKTKGLKHDEAYISVTFYDAKHKALETITSEAIRGTTDWRRMRINPSAPRQ